MGAGRRRGRRVVQAGQEAETAARPVPALQAAISWLKNATDDIRNARLAPLGDQAREIWAQLRQESNVDLGAIRLSGSGTRRQVEVNVTIDGSPGAALGVMSQGEVNALALSIFLPRATVAASPFRFLVIDDPVQAMDPAKVDGLARVLEDVARSRQVIVFTHDDRLPEAVRRLGIPARILEVTRRPESVVRIRPALTPVERLLKDADDLCLDDAVPEDVAAQVVPGYAGSLSRPAFTEGDPAHATPRGKAARGGRGRDRSCQYSYQTRGPGDVRRRLEGRRRAAPAQRLGSQRRRHLSGPEQGHPPGPPRVVALAGQPGPATDRNDQPKTAMTPTELLAAARAALADKSAGAAEGGWPRMVALLTRQSLEKALSEFWAASPRTSGLGDCTRKSQLACLPFYLDARAAREAAYIWAALSDACHYHAYELAPTAAELAGWIDAVDRLIQSMRAKAPVP